MSTISIDIISHLQEKDQEKISYFANLLLKKREYKALSKEISARKNEIRQQQTLSHESIWSNFNV